jgi:hypothetical protein
MNRVTKADVIEELVRMGVRPQTLIAKKVGVSREYVRLIIHERKLPYRKRHKSIIKVQVGLSREEERYLRKVSSGAGLSDTIKQVVRAKMHSEGRENFNEER